MCADKSQTKRAWNKQNILNYYEFIGGFALGRNFHTNLIK